MATFVILVRLFLRQCSLTKTGIGSVIKTTDMKERKNLYEIILLIFEYLEIILYINAIN